MPTTFNSDLHRYVTKNDIRQMRRYSGKAIYLPDGKGLQYFNKFQDVEVNGDGFMDSNTGLFKQSNPHDQVSGFLKNHGNTIASVLDVAGKAAANIAGIAKSVEEIKLLKEQRKAMEELKRAKSR